MLLYCHSKTENESPVYVGQSEGLMLFLREDPNAAKDLKVILPDPKADDEIKSLSKDLKCDFDEFQVKFKVVERVAISF